MNFFRENILRSLLSSLESNPKVHGAWEGGSAANGSTDQFSDIDLIIFGSDSIDEIFDSIESTLDENYSITHKYTEKLQFLPDYYQRIYFIEGAPKHFFLDIGIFLKESEGVFTELLQIERHGTPVIYFDKLDLIKPIACNIEKIKIKHRERLSEIEGFFPVYKTLVLKELDRGNSIDAFAFYFGGLLKPLVELMGMLHRPFQFDFNLRYLHKSFPEKDRKTIENLLYVPSEKILRERISIIDTLFDETRLKVKEHLGKTNRDIID
jgi:predicted nucleotidyltransferase